MTRPILQSAVCRLCARRFGRLPGQPPLCPACAANDLLTVYRDDQRLRQQVAHSARSARRRHAWRGDSGARSSAVRTVRLTPDELTAYLATGLLPPRAAAALAEA